MLLRWLIAQEKDRQMDHQGNQVTVVQSVQGLWGIHRIDRRMANSVLDTQENHFREEFHLAGGSEWEARGLSKYEKSLPNKS